MSGRLWGSTYPADYLCCSYRENVEPQPVSVSCLLQGPHCLAGTHLVRSCGSQGLLTGSRVFSGVTEAQFLSSVGQG